MDKIVVSGAVAGIAIGISWCYASVGIFTIV